MKIQQSKLGKRKLPYYCNKSDFLLLESIKDKSKTTTEIIKTSNKSIATAAYKRLKILVKDKLVDINNFHYSITNKGKY